MADHCRSAENFIHNLLPRATRGYLHKLISSGHLTVNGNTAAANTLFQLGDQVNLKESARTRAFLAAKRPRIDIIFEDQWYFACNKPPGLPMHRTTENEEQNLVTVGEQFLNDRDGRPCKLRPVNRLDRGTSGVVLLAKSSTAAGILGRMVMEEGLDKLYLAMVHGILPDSGTIDHPLDGKEAVTDFTTIFTGNRLSLALIWPLTGRMHQIRQHLAQSGHPIIGDRRYGGGSLDNGTSHLLHSFRTSFQHPFTSQRIILHAPLSPLLLSQMEKLAGEELPEILRQLTDLSNAAPESR